MTVGEAGGHPSARRVLGISQELSLLFALVLRKIREVTLLDAGLQVPQDIRQHIVRKLVEHLGLALGREHFNEFLPGFRRHVFEDVRRLLVSEGFQKRQPAVILEGLQQSRGVRRMHAGHQLPHGGGVPRRQRAPGPVPDPVHLRCWRLPGTSPVSFPAPDAMTREKNRMRFLC